MSAPDEKSMSKPMPVLKRSLEIDAPAGKREYELIEVAYEG